MRKGAFLFLALLICFHISGQNRKKDQEVEIINHEVQLGESIRLISKKYLVDPAEIYKLNKFAVDGVTQGMILKIPVPKKEQSVIEQEEHGSNQEPAAETVPEKKPEERDLIEKPNPAKPVKVVDQEKPQVVPEKEKKESVVYERTSDSHTVVPKETLFSLSRKYGVSVEEIKKANPELQNGGLKIGQLITIPASGNGNHNETIASNNSVAISIQEPIKTETQQSSGSSASSEVITHVVAPKETLYSLSKRYNVTVDEIKQQNQMLLSRGLQIGQTLTIRKH